MAKDVSYRPLLLELKMSLYSPAKRPYACIENIAFNLDKITIPLIFCLSNLLRTSDSFN